LSADGTNDKGEAMARILVTGASSGLGLLTVETLTAQGHEVVLHARNSRRVAATSAARHPGPVILGDLSNLDETVNVAQQATLIGRFDAIIHNAGVTEAAHLMAVNVVAPYVLTCLVGADRVITLSSDMHASGSDDLDAVEANVTGSRRGATYSDSKLYATALTLALAERRPQILAHAVDPGWVPTRMGGSSAPDDLDEGHRTQEWLATAPEDDIDPRTGGYWYHRAPQAPHPASLDPAFQDAIITALHAHTGLRYPS